MSGKLDLADLPPLPPSRSPSPSPSPSSSHHSSSGKKTGVKAKRHTAVALVLPDQNAFPSESGKKQQQVNLDRILGKMQDLFYI